MREIKFRAWDSIEKKMKYFDILDYMAIQDLICYDGNMYMKFTLMQYTGLKDVNGTDLYEGDIVKGNRESYRSECIGVVKYGALAFAYVGTVKGGGEWFDTVTNPKIKQAPVEIIGNIYENPELLKDCKCK